MILQLTCFFDGTIIFLLCVSRCVHVLLEARRHHESCLYDTKLNVNMEVENMNMSVKVNVNANMNVKVAWQLSASVKSIDHAVLLWRARIWDSY